MNEQLPYFSAGSNKYAYAQVFTATPKRHAGSLRGRLHVPTVRRRTARRGPGKI